jgi:hypothetical protein
MLIREMWHAVVPTGVYEHQIDATIAVPIGTTTAAMKKMEKVFLKCGNITCKIYGEYIICSSIHL